ncbi:MAG: gcrA cell cycle regulator family protein [Alphaproteobacteria bacterium]|nr:gcrA cell cycle regulator family protein [Alphaproteobacteria bacterium]MBV8549418.1 gcrA cell cycle regulator family protein [Alphaproteobacteria bacterium]
MSWTDQQIKMLKDMWGHGYSASEIAGRLGGGLTRNAVIGKAHRLKLSAQANSAKSEAANITRVSGASVGAGVAVSVKAARKRTMLRPLPVVPVPSATATATIIAKPSTQTTALRDIFRPVEGLKRGEGIAVIKAGERHCRWPVGDPRSPDFRFCGCTAHEGLPYCIDHARVAYQNVGKKFRASDAGEAN